MIRAFGLLERYLLEEDLKVSHKPGGNYQIYQCPFSAELYKDIPFEDQVAQFLEPAIRSLVEILPTDSPLHFKSREGFMYIGRDGIILNFKVDTYVQLLLYCSQVP